jgi:hypothetical protein
MLVETQRNVTGTELDGQADLQLKLRSLLDISLLDLSQECCVLGCLSEQG